MAALEQVRGLGAGADWICRGMEAQSDGGYP